MSFWQTAIFIPLAILITVLIFAIPGYFLGIHPALLFCGFLLIGGLFQFVLSSYQAIPQELLKHRVELELIEKMNAAANTEFFKEQVSKFRVKILPSDEIWYWESPEESWRSKRGRAGYVIVRQGKATRHYIITGMN